MTQLPLRLSKSLLDDWYAQIAHARPFLKWAGGKSAFIVRYSKIFPAFDGKILEPFLGGGAVFFFLVRKSKRLGRAVLGDLNRDLIKTFEQVRDQPEDVWRRLELMREEFKSASDKAAYYYSIRDLANNSRPRTDAAVFIFLNKTCWNALYRVNRDGRFNVPFGAPKGELLNLDRRAFFAASAALQQAQFRATSWENVVAMAEPGDFVFLDPPYFSDLATDDIKYGFREFSARDHDLLAQAAQNLAHRNIAFVLTNSGEAQMESLYQRLGLKVQRVRIPRYINSNINERTAVDELIVTPPWMSQEI